MVNTPPPSETGIKSSRREDIAVELRKRTIVIYHVLEQDLDILISGYMSVPLAFAGAFFSATITFWVAYFSMPPEEPKKNLFLIAAVLATALFIYSSAMTLNDWLKKRRTARRIKNETTVEPTFVTSKKN